MNDYEKRYNNLVKEHINTIERNENKAKEIERLNNIINELEKILYARIYNAETKEEKIYSIEDKSILDKLQELKGSDKE